MRCISLERVRLSLFWVCVHAPLGKGLDRTRRGFISLRGEPAPSVGQSVQEPVNQRRRRYQILQLQVEDSLKALGPLGTELFPYTQNTTQRRGSLGRGGRRAAAQMVSETADHFILQLLDTF